MCMVLPPVTPPSPVVNLDDSYSSPDVNDYSAQTPYAARPDLPSPVVDITDSVDNNGPVVLNPNESPQNNVPQNNAPSEPNTPGSSQPQNDALNASNHLRNTADSELFTRLETAKQGNLNKADGKMSRNDLKAALKRGGLSPEDRAVAEYLLANFDSITGGRHIRADDLRAHAAGIELSGTQNLPLEGLKSFTDDRNASSFFGLIRHDEDFRKLASGTSISATELERGLNDEDFTPAQQAAIAFLLQNLDAIGGSDGRIQEKELSTVVNTIERTQVSNSLGEHRVHLQDFQQDNNLFGALSGSTGMRSTITQDELAQGLNNGNFTEAQKSAIAFMQQNFDAIARGDQSISRSDLQAITQYDVASLNKTLMASRSNYDAANQARSATWQNPAQLSSFINKVDSLFTGDDRGHRFGFISIDRGEPGYGPFDNRSNFNDPFSLFGNKKAEPDGHLSRNDLEAALTAENVTADERNLALVLLNNFANIGNNKSTINAEDIVRFFDTGNDAVMP